MVKTSPHDCVGVKREVSDVAQEEVEKIIGFSRAVTVIEGCMVWEAREGRDETVAIKASCQGMWRGVCFCCWRGVCLMSCAVWEVCGVRM